MMGLVGAKLQGGAAAISAVGGPEVPSPADTPAEPETPSTPEEPVVPDSPAQPEYAPGPDVPTPPNSPAEPPPAPPEISASGTGEPIQIIKPRANSFGLPQATVGVRSDEAPPQETASATRPAGGLASAVLTTRALVEQKLSGNNFYAAANLLGQLQILPPTDGGDEIAPPDGFEGALALLRREAAHLTGTAQDEATRIIAALENVLIPPVAAKPAEAAASASTEAQAEAPRRNRKPAPARASTTWPTPLGAECSRCPPPTSDRQGPLMTAPLPGWLSSRNPLRRLPHLCPRQKRKWSARHRSRRRRLI